jgi:hypothetical protein
MKNTFRGRIERIYTTQFIRNLRREKKLLLSRPLKFRNLRTALVFLSGKFSKIYKHGIGKLKA